MSGPYLMGAVDRIAQLSRIQGQFQKLSECL